MPTDHIRTTQARLCGAIAIALWIAAPLLEHDLGLALVFLPVAALFAVLLLGRAPGEALITRLRERRAPRSRARARHRTNRPTERRRVSGGTLLARRLAGRAPPRSLPATY
jgi:hypothetical protein